MLNIINKKIAVFLVMT